MTKHNAFTCEKITGCSEMNNEVYTQKFEMTVTTFGCCATLFEILVDELAPRSLHNLLVRCYKTITCRE